MCSLRDWIKTIEKIGVVLGKVQDIQHVFNYFEDEGTGSLDYKRFAQRVFTKQTKFYKTENSKNNDKKEKNSVQNKKNIYFEKILNLMKDAGGPGILTLNKEFKVL